MTTWKRASVSAAAIAALATILAGCSSTATNPNQARLPGPQPVGSVQNSQVATTNLPSIGQDSTGQPLQTSQVAPGLSGQPVLGGQAQPNTMTLSGGTGIGDPANPAPLQTASTDGGFVTLDTMGAVPTAPGRDLSGGLSIEKLLGGWTIVSGAEQCKLNLTYTAKTGTNRYRASTPGCGLSGLAVVASWQLTGTQVQLYDEAGDMVAALILSGNRFIGTLAGGQSISMVG
ncbi:MAG TPA: AprI/Inh family metalloprotease inhibitor [Devosia sp.]